ncbi:MAG TPA: primosomal protein N' [Burkholderiaceae bacterium]|nr:primosomal protein N' [Burkholderiaceae bacterium]
MSSAKLAARYAQVILDVPLAQPLEYALIEASARRTDIGLRCVVPLGRRAQVGIIVGISDRPAIDPDKIKPITHVLDEIAPLSLQWLQLTRFAAEYYQHPWGEVALPALPRALRSVPGPRHEQSLARLRARSMARWTEATAAAVNPTAEQSTAIETLRSADGFAPHLLFGVTSSGKTEVYLAAIARTLASDATAQALLLVPEINLTPQLEALLRARFPDDPVVALHSGLADAERAAAWLAAHEGRARIVVGTRLAVFSSMPHLAIIVVDEEHDPSYRAGEGVRYSARDLAVKRTQLLDIPIVLGSATPSLETWAQARAGRYRLLQLTQRVGGAGGPQLAPAIELIDARIHKPQNGLSAPITRALAEAFERGEQSLVFLNRRGYAPVVTCEACGWLSNCPRCSAFAVFHKSDRTLRCHHCGYAAAIPRACPTCGNQHLKGVGQGTQRIEETLHALLPTARVARIDRDSTRQRHAAKHALDAVHAGAVDVLVGTQMISKGHDFQRVSLVVVLNPDGQLASHDFRAPERLFSTLMQVAGRAGRAGLPSKVLVQTRFAQHPLFAALARHDYAQFAQQQLAERAAAQMPPITHQALLTAEARTMEAALGFLRNARAAVLPELAAVAPRVRLFDPVPMTLQRLAGVARAQLLIEADQRTHLHALLGAWLTALRAQRTAVRWNIEVDPAEL